MFGNLLSDSRYVIRLQRRSPAFAVATVLTLALGIGANTAIFSLLDRVVLRALPVQESERLFTLGIANHTDAATPLVLFSFPFFEDLRVQNEVFSHMLAYRTLDVTLSTATGGERVRTTYATDDYFSGLGVGAAIGRPLVLLDNQGRNGAVAVLSYELWQRRFAGDPSIVGQAIRVNDSPVTVVGVAPRGFFGAQLGTSPDLWMPLSYMPGIAGQLLQLRSAMSLSVVARLKPGFTREQAEASISSLWQSLPPAQAGPAVALQKQPLRLLPGTRALSSLQRQFGEPLWALMGLVGFVLLIMCANLSSLLIVRALGRRGEMATRAALGASRLRIIQPLLIESLLFSIGGMACGVVGAYWAVDTLLTFLPVNRFVLDVEPSGTVLAFSVLLTLVLGVLLGVLPATQVMRLDLRTLLSMESGAVTGGVHRFGLRQLLVVAQVALSVILVIGAGLFVRSLTALESVDSGLRGERVLQMALDPAAAGYPPPAAIQFYTRVLDTVRALPGIQSAAFATLPLLGTARARDNFFPGGYVPRQGQDNASLLSFVSPDIFSTLGIPLVRGRAFTERDDADAPLVIVVNEPYATRFFGNRDAIGQRIGNGGVPQFEIVGIVGATKFSDLREEPPLMVFRPAAQFGFASERTLYVRTTGDAGTALEPVRAAVRGLDPNVPLSEVKTFADQIDETLVQERLTATLSSWFGGLALFLTGLGLYGLVSYNLSRRRRDFALRLVLGASPTSLMGAIMREVMIPVGLGTAIGIAVALPLARRVGTLLFDITPMDTQVAIAAAVVMNAIAIVAAGVPAWRARGVDPARVLRMN